MLLLQIRLPVEDDGDGGLRGRGALLIAAELLAAQGKPVDIGGYYWPDETKCAAAMRPSATLNAIIEQM